MWNDIAHLSSDELRFCGFVCAVTDIIWLLFYLSVLTPVHNYCHERFGFITYVFLLVFWDHKEMQALFYIHIQP